MFEIMLKISPSITANKRSLKTSISRLSGVTLSVSLGLPAVARVLSCVWLQVLILQVREQYPLMEKA